MHRFDVWCWWYLYVVHLIPNKPKYSTKNKIILFVNITMKVHCTRTIISFVLLFLNPSIIYSKKKTRISIIYCMMVLSTGTIFPLFFILIYAILIENISYFYIYIINNKMISFNLIMRKNVRGTSTFICIDIFKIKRYKLDYFNLFYISFIVLVQGTK